MSPALLAYTVRRVLWALPVLFAISVIVFLMLRLAPGDPVDTLLGQRYDEETAARLQAKYGYDRPVYEQYVKYMGNLFQGDLGVSTRHQDFSVSEVIVPKIRISAQMGLFALIITLFLGLPVGIYAALFRGTFLDPLLIGSWLFLDAIPVFVSATLLQWVFAVKLDLVELGYEGVYHKNMLLPILVISLPGVAGVARLMRASIVQVMSEDYVRTARAKGLRERTVVITHITRNAMLPMVTVIGLALPGIFAGSLFVELLWGIPGIGSEALEAVRAPDFDVVLALVLFGSVLFVLANLIIDLTYAFIDPRIRLGEARG